MAVEGSAQPGQTLAAYVEKRWGGPVRPILSSNIAVATSATRIFPNNPRRMEWTLTNHGSGSVYLGHDSGVVAASGLLLPPNGGSITFSADEDGEAVGYEVWAIAVATGNNVAPYEVIRK